MQGDEAGGTVATSDGRSRKDFLRRKGSDRH